MEKLRNFKKIKKKKRSIMNIKLWFNHLDRKIIVVVVTVIVVVIIIIIIIVVVVVVVVSIV